jgi:hypothetical protein
MRLAPGDAAADLQMALNAGLVEPLHAREFHEAEHLGRREVAHVAPLRSQGA